MGQIRSEIIAAVSCRTQYHAFRQSQQNLETKSKLTSSAVDEDQKMYYAIVYLWNAELTACFVIACLPAVNQFVQNMFHRKRASHVTGSGEAGTPGSGPRGLGEKTEGR